MTRLVLLNGASGAGKTTAAEMLVQQCPALDHIHPDGLWDTPAMDSEEILGKAAAVAARGAERTVVVDCQIRPFQIQQVVEPFSLDFTMFLLDCPDSVREARLVERGWSGGDFARMSTWQTLLKKESEELGYPILDTSEQPVESCCEVILHHLNTGR